jgi:CubicO group peptidase (beta-lactamase class C family)
MKRFLGLLIALGAWVVWAAPALADFQAAADYSASYRGISMLVIQDGEVVFEDYPNDGAADRVHPLASGTKSFSGILAAAAVQDGLLTLDEKVSDTITEWQDTPKADITIRQLLNLTSGLPAPRRARRVPPYNIAIRVALESQPGQAFIYSPVPFQVFGELIKRKLDGEDPVDYLTRRIFEPIGMTVGSWRQSRSENSTLPLGARLTARDWGRFGEFILAHGEWDGEQLVDRDAFDQLFIGSDVNPAYGLTFWLNEPVDFRFAADTPPLDTSTDYWQHEDIFPDDMVMAAGAGDQRLFISWERNMVVVRQAEGIMGAMLGHRLSWSDVQFWRLLDAPPGEHPEPLPPVDIPDQPRGAVELPTGAILRLPPADEPDDQSDTGNSDESDDDGDFVGPTF